MRTLALDTAAPSPNLAILEGAEPAAELWLGARPNAGRRVLEAVDALLRAEGCDVADVGRIVVGVGPGGFTGLRIGLATALALAQALAVECVGASSLEALALSVAEAVPDAGVVVPVLDARRGEVFAAAYRSDGRDGLSEVLAPSALSPAELEERLGALASGERLAAGGSGLGLLGDALSDAVRVLREGPGSSPRAANLVRRVAAGAARPVVPDYARLPDAEQSRLRAALR